MATKKELEQRIKELEHRVAELEAAKKWRDQMLVRYGDMIKEAVNAEKGLKKATHYLYEKMKGGVKRNALKIDEAKEFFLSRYDHWVEHQPTKTTARAKANQETAERFGTTRVDGLKYADSTAIKIINSRAETP